MKNILKYILVIILSLDLSSCNEVILDPNSTLEPDVVNSVENLSKLINGVQLRWSTGRTGVIYNLTHISGLNTNELRLLNPGNLDENEILLGGSEVSGSNGILNNIWTNTMLTIKEATTVIDNADVAASDTTISNSLKAYGLFYRAIARGTLIQYFESIPLEIIDNATFKNRIEVLQSAISDLRIAKGYIGIGLSTQVTSIVFNSVDLENSVSTLLARFNLMLGNYDEAIVEANAVNTSVISVWKYDAAVPNPLAFYFGSQNVTQARDLNFGLPVGLLPNANDQRIAFYVTEPTPLDFQVKGFWKTDLEEIPVYLPSEILLIKSESYARKDKLADAVIELNKVLIKTSSNDAFGLGANLPAYSGEMTKEAILDEIYKNRRIELYLTGLSLEDSRRFNRPGPSQSDSERNRNYYPYPNSERDNNTNTPENPSS